MKNLSTLALILGAFLLFSCTQKVANDYYLITLQMPSVGSPTTKPDVQVEHLQSYPNDSIAIASETARAKSFREGLSESREKTIREQVGPSDDDYRAQMERQLIDEAYDELAGLEFVLIRVSHTEGSDLAEYLELVKEYGLESEKVQQYVSKNGFDVLLHTIKY